MKITESQLRKIVREEILREGVGSTYMSTASGPDYGKYVDTLGAEKAADIYHGATSKAGMGASPDARNRMAIAELEKAYQDALAAGAPEADGGFMAWLKGLLGKR